jgi:IS5 family transposase
MLLVGYYFGIPSERRLCEAVHLNLAYRWFCRLDLTNRIPDHSTFSKNRPSQRCCTSPADQRTAQKRRKKVEMLFAHLKRILGLGRLRRRGPSRDHGCAMTLPGSACRVQDEFTLPATAQNLRKPAKLKPLPPACT